MIYLLVAVVVFLVIYISVKIHNKKKLIKERQEREQREQRERERIEALKLKFKGNTTVQGWAKEAAEVISEYIGRVPHREHKFHFKPYEEDISFGYNLQDIWLPNIREFIRNDGCCVINSYNFLQYNLPKLDNDSEMNVFAESFCELVQIELQQKKISTNIGEIRRAVDKNGYNVDFMENSYIYVLSYYPPQASGQW